MNVTIDREKWLQSILDDEPEPSVPLAVPPHFHVTLRKHPEADAGKLPAMAAVLIRYIQQLDRNLGGEGVFFDPAGTVHTDAKLTLRLMVMPAGDIMGRIAAIHTALSELKANARRDVVATQDADVNAQIAAELDSLPRDVAEHLEPVAR